MATKRTKSVGNDLSYWTNASKQFSWPIDYAEKLIFVPEDELQYAEDDLMVSHFRKNGWHIQSCISIIHTKVFIKPQTPGPIFRGDLKPNVVEKEQSFKCNQKFQVKSTGTVLMIVEVTKKSIMLKYIDGGKSDIPTTAENLLKSLKMGVFIML